MEYGKLKPLDQYPTVDNALQDFQHTKFFLQTPKEDRQHVIEVFEKKYGQVITIKNAEHAAQTQGPDITERMNQAVTKYLTDNVGPDSAAVASAILPNSNAQAMIDTSMILMPEAGGAFELASPLARLGLRVGIPALAGAVGGSVQGGPSGMASGAASGAGQALGGEAISVGLGLGRRAVRDYDFGRLTGWLKNRFGIDVPDKAAFYRMFKGGEANQKTQEVLDKVVAKVAKKAKAIRAAGPTKVDIPNELAQPLAKAGHLVTLKGDQLFGNFNDLNKALSSLEDMGWDDKHIPTRTDIGRAARTAAHQIEGEMATQLQTIDPKLASEWYTAKANNRLTKNIH